MTIKAEPHPCWILTCEGCELEFTHDGEIGVHFHSEQAAKDEISYGDQWKMVDGKHLCDECVTNAAAAGGGRAARRASASPSDLDRAIAKVEDEVAKVKDILAKVKATRRKEREA